MHIRNDDNLFLYPRLDLSLKWNFSLKIKSCSVAARYVKHVYTVLNTHSPCSAHAQLISIFSHCADLLAALIFTAAQELWALAKWQPPGKKKQEHAEGYLGHSLILAA